MKIPKKKARPAWWSWPRSCTPPSEYSPREQQAVAAHPMYTGLGIHPRIMSDEAWIASVIKVRNSLGKKEFWEGWIEMLKHTAFLWVHSTKHITRASPGKELNKLNRMSSDEQWDKSIQTIALDPSYTGIMPYCETYYPALWAEGPYEAEERMKLPEVFKHLLANMRKAWPVTERREEGVVL